MFHIAEKVFLLFHNYWIVFDHPIIHFSEAEPKGSDCYEKFSTMQDCMKGHPEVYDEKTSAGGPTEEADAPKEGSNESSPVEQKDDREAEKPAEEGDKPAEETDEPLKTSSEKAVQP